MIDVFERRFSVDESVHRHKLAGGLRVCGGCSYELIWDDRCYPHKAILGTAYELAIGQRLAGGDFEGGNVGAVRVLRKLGFDVQPLP